ncbi:hypothetical protein [Furfurilactobacillus milii]|uniref:Uncharacterized protein n=1 Tax=Furfurilactobacillus rossiae TaxID=231049 RepID=A0A7C9MNA3_9LACO|nr:hypothetical protein [Furfurilactobacillus milii]MYV04844.1 hypothetical protein [Furfurilactobacillus milii]
MDESIPLALTVNGLYSMGNRYLQADLNTFSVKRVYGVTVLTSIFSDGEVPSKDGLVLSATSGCKLIPETTFKRAYNE